jgi:hypothetical protein
MPYRMFLLSPALEGGRRAQQLLDDDAELPLARRFREGTPVTLGEAFTYLSGLYFRGKLEYATRFARPPLRRPGVWIITPIRGLLPAEQPVTRQEVAQFDASIVSPSDPRYRIPLERDSLVLGTNTDTDFILLGSEASDRNAELLVSVLGTRLLYPGEFVGRNDMTRAALMLRAARTGKELHYQSLAAALRRAPRLTP